MKLRSLSVACAIALVTPLIAMAEVDIGKLYTGSNRIQQGQVNKDSADLLSRDEIRLAGMRMFTNPFTKDQGFGDGNHNPPSPSESGNHEGERGTLQNNGTFQRINGLDAQTCLECHSIVSRRTVPMKFGIGGVGGVNNTVLGAGGGTLVDLKSVDKKTNINGRVINPPFIFGAGGVELLANEMTKELNDQLAAAPAGATTSLSAKGVGFGTITKNADGSVAVNAEHVATDVKGVFDTRYRVDLNEDGVITDDELNDDFLVVAPFGRKGDAKSTRTFDIGALSFHFGMAVDGGIDHDGDTKTDEVLKGELSALSVFVATAQTPKQKKVKGEALRGKQIMSDIGCTECHIPSMETNGKILGFRTPEVGNDPSANEYYSVDLTQKPMHFKKNDNGGITISLFADLKRHYMGENLENFAGDGMFTTMRLWGVADTAPYLHDGRALTITDAIKEHGEDLDSEAFTAVDKFNGMSVADQNAVLAFLDTLRSPNGSFKKLQDLAKDVAEAQGVK